MHIDKLRRLVRVTKLLYRQEAAEVAKLQGERSSLLDSMESAAQRLDADSTSAFDASLAIAWAGRRRRELARADGRLEEQLKSAGSALASLKGAESRLTSEEDKLERAAEMRALEQVIENVVRRDSSFGQDGTYTLGAENGDAACSPRSSKDGHDK
jgi:hypothetical protein